MTTTTDVAARVRATMTKTRRKRNAPARRSERRDVRAGGGKGLLIGLILGGVVVVLGGVGLTLFLVVGGSDPIRGKWESNQFGAKISHDLPRGSFTTTVNLPSLPGMPNLAPMSVSGSYRVKDKNLVETTVSEAELKRAVDDMRKQLGPLAVPMVRPLQELAAPRCRPSASKATPSSSAAAGSNA